MQGLKPGRNDASWLPRLKAGGFHRSCQRAPCLRASVVNPIYCTVKLTFAVFCNPVPAVPVMVTV